MNNQDLLSYLVRMTLSVICSPPTWIPALRYSWRLRTSWRHLWLPSRSYLEFRITTAFGSSGPSGFDPVEFRRFITWAMAQKIA